MLEFVKSNHVIFEATDATENVRKIRLRSIVHKNFYKRCRFMGIKKHEKKFAGNLIEWDFLRIYRGLQIP